MRTNSVSASSVSLPNLVGPEHAVGTLSEAWILYVLWVLKGAVARGVVHTQAVRVFAVLLDTERVRTGWV